MTDRPTSPSTVLRTSLLDLQPQALGDWLTEQGQPRYRANQLLHWAYRGARSYQEMSDLPSSLRQRLEQAFPLRTLTEASETNSPDGRTRKVAFHLHDGGVIEAVHMRHPSSGGAWRTTICISSQAGCAYGCRFCATGQQGYGRNLSVGEIVEQVVYFFRENESGSKAPAEVAPLGSHHSESPSETGYATKPTRITNVVFMGMGEPFANYEAVRDATRALNAPWGLGLGARHITVSTVGLAPQIHRFAQEPFQVGLAVSLHAPTDALRDQLMPVNRKYPLKEVMAACRTYVKQTNRRLTFEYVLLERVNDNVVNAQELAKLLGGLLCHVNLIPVNPTAASEFKRPAPERTHAFVQELRKHGIPTTLRDTQGMEIQAGCGQLRARVDGDKGAATLRSR